MNQENQLDIFFLFFFQEELQEHETHYLNLQFIMCVYVRTFFKCNCSYRRTGLKVFINVFKTPNVVL